MSAGEPTGDEELESAGTPSGHGELASAGEPVLELKLESGPWLLGPVLEPEPWLLGPVLEPGERISDPEKGSKNGDWHSGLHEKTLSHSGNELLNHGMLATSICAFLRTASLSLLAEVLLHSA